MHAFMTHAIRAAVLSTGAALLLGGCILPGEYVPPFTTGSGGELYSPVTTGNNGLITYQPEGDGTATLVGAALAINGSESAIAYSGAVLNAAPPFGVSTMFGPGTTVATSTGDLVSWTPNSGANLFSVAAGTAITADKGTDTIISWGRWTDGTVTGAMGQPGTQNVTLNANQGHHFVIGRLTPEANLPMTGTATFNLVGATKPTFGDGALAPGTFAGTAAVQWGGATSNTRVGVNFTVTMPGDATYNIVSTGGTANPSASNIQLLGTALGAPSQFSGAATTTTTAGANRACAGAATCFTQVNGFFAGDFAQRIGVSYRVNVNPGTQGTSIYGAAAFAR